MGAVVVGAFLSACSSGGSHGSSSGGVGGTGIFDGGQAGQPGSGGAVGGGGIEGTGGVSVDGGGGAPVADANAGDGDAAGPDDACATYASSFCNAYQKCAPYYVASTYVDVQGCSAKQKALCLAASSANGSGATPAKLRACAAARDAITCEDLLSNHPPPDCLVPGSLPAGSSCGSDWQCAGPHGYCHLDSPLCGTCAVQSAAGGSCVQDLDCQPGLRCGNPAGATGTWTCVAPASAGATCDSTHPCLGTLTCLGGQCATPLDVGVPCNFQNRDSYDWECDILAGRGRGRFCSPSSGMCIQAELSGPGQPCNTSGIDCVQVRVCTYADPTQSTGTCQAPISDGAPCDPATKAVCAPPSQCVGGVCKFPDPTTCG